MVLFDAANTERRKGNSIFVNAKNYGATRFERNMSPFTHTHTQSQGKSTPRIFIYIKKHRPRQQTLFYRYEILAVICDQIDKTAEPQWSNR